MAYRTDKYLERRFDEKVKFGKSDECWEWLGWRLDGYGRMRWRGRVQGAHRVSWFLMYGEIPDGMLVLHHCDNRGCVNPDHLFLGTNQDNIDDRERKGRGVWPINRYLQKRRLDKYP